MRVGQRWWGLIGIGVLALSIAFVPVPSFAAAPTDRTIQIEASSFDYNPSTITINPGDHITFELVATDVVHGLYLDGYDLNLTADPGQTARLTFTANKPGTFRFRCSVTCGPLHPFMIGKLNVGEDWLLWRAVGLVLLAAVAGAIAGRR